MSRYQVELTETSGHKHEFTAQNYEEILEYVLDALYPQHTQDTQRQQLQNDYDIHQLIDAYAVCELLNIKGMLSVDRKIEPKKKYRPHRKGMIEVTLVKSNLKFVVSKTEDIYESLKSRLYPLFKPSDTTFRFQLHSYMLTPIDSSKQPHELVQDLIQHGVLNIKELQHAESR